MVHGEGKWSSRKGTRALGILTKYFNELCSTEMLIFCLLLGLYLLCIRRWAQQLHLAGKGKDETLLREQESQSWDVQMGRGKMWEGNVWRRTREERTNVKSEGRAEQNSAELYGWLFWVGSNIWIKGRYSIHADEPGCSKMWWKSER